MTYSPSEIHDVAQRPLRPTADDRGVLIELHRTAWTTGFAPAQWNLAHPRTTAQSD